MVARPDPDAFSKFTYGTSEPMKDLSLRFEGPFTFTEGDHCVFRSPSANSPGIYLWTVRQKKDNTHLIHYVGETNWLGKRHREHLVQILGLNYGIFDADKAQEGACELRWNGLWRDRAPEASIRATVEYSQLHEVVVKYISVIEIFFAELEIELNLRKHIEGCIGWNLRNNHPECKQLYPDDNHIGTMKEKRIGLLHIEAAESIRGLDAIIPY
jgi:hypothetical protein